MKRVVIISISATIAILALAGCQLNQTQQDTLVGSGLGAGAGALIGGASGHAGTGALVGAAAGAIGGSLIGGEKN